MRLLRSIQLHRSRDARGDCQLVRRSARVLSERARGRREGRTLKSVGVQRSLAMRRALGRW